MEKINCRDWTSFDSLIIENKRIDIIDLKELGIIQNELDVSFNTELKLINCSLGTIDFACSSLKKKLTLINCEIEWMNFYSTYFPGGLEIKDCKIINRTTFNSGLHNLKTNPVIIHNSVFNGFVDFFDVFFGGPVEISNNDFIQGTNLSIYINEMDYQGNPIDLKLKNNSGDLKTEEN